MVVRTYSKPARSVSHVRGFAFEYGALRIETASRGGQCLAVRNSVDGSYSGISHNQAEIHLISRLIVGR